MRHDLWVTTLGEFTLKKLKKNKNKNKQTKTKKPQTNKQTNKPKQRQKKKKKKPAKFGRGICILKIDSVETKCDVR